MLTIKDVINQLQKLESSTPKPLRIYVAGPEVPAASLADFSDDRIYYSKRAYLCPETVDDQNMKDSWFILVELKRKWIPAFKSNTLVVVVSLCRGTCSGWSTMDDTTIPLTTDAISVFKGRKAAANFDVEGLGCVSVYFY